MGSTLLPYSVEDGHITYSEERAITDTRLLPQTRSTGLSHEVDGGHMSSEEQAIADPRDTGRWFDRQPRAHFDNRWSRYCEGQQRPSDGLYPSMQDVVQEPQTTCCNKPVERTWRRHSVVISSGRREAITPTASTRFHRHLVAVTLACSCIPFAFSCPSSGISTESLKPNQRPTWVLRMAIQEVS